MGFFAGDLKSITIKHQVEGTVILECKASQDNSYDLGGIRKTEVAVTGNGTPIYKMNNVPWEVDALVAWDMLVAEELQALGRIAASTIEADITIDSINGSVYGAKGSVISDLKANVNDSTVPTKFGGGGTLKRVA
jgi:hypothetical protein